MMEIKTLTTGARKLQVATASPRRTPLMVVSHERSGTHFLMNSLARGYGYVSNPWINLDIFPFAINYYYPPEIDRVLTDFARLNVVSITKSHHPVGFFDGVLDGILERYTVFYIHRDPVDVMLSFFQFMHHWPWNEGPKMDDPIEFARAQPEGQMLRYQISQQPSLLHRWQSHVEGWMEAAATRSRIVVVRYEDLRDRYAATVGGFTRTLGREAGDLQPPPREKDTIHVPGDPARSALAKAPETVRRLRGLATELVGETMAKLGYDLA